MMSVPTVRSWTPRGLFCRLRPQFFRHPRTSAELLGAPRTQKVPQDADEHHESNQPRILDFENKVFLNYSSKIFEAGERPLDGAWSAATGEWVPRTALQATPILCPTLGKTVAGHITGRRDIWLYENSLLIPPSLRRAFDEWAVVVVPKNPRQDFAITPEPYVFRVMDKHHAALSEPLYENFKSKRGNVLVGDLEGSRLDFADAQPINPMYLLFQTCCAVWKKEYLADPQKKDAANFYARFDRHVASLWPDKLIRETSITKAFRRQA